MTPKELAAIRANAEDARELAMDPGIAGAAIADIPVLCDALEAAWRELDELRARVAELEAVKRVTP